jgi:hypothetical protein
VECQRVKDLGGQGGIVVGKRGNSDEDIKQKREWGLRDRDQNKRGRIVCKEEIYGVIFVMCSEDGDD